MSGRERFFRNGAMLAAVGLSIRTVAMLFGAFVSRSVGAEGMGLYTVIMTVYSFAVTFATSGISLTVTRLVAEAEGEGNGRRVGGVIRGAVLYSLTFGLAATLLLFFGAGIIGKEILHDQRTVESLRLLSLSLLPAALGAALSGYFVGVRRISFNAAAQVLTQLGKVAVTVVLVVRASGQGTAASVRALCLGIVVTEGIGLLISLLQFLYDRHRHGGASDAPRVGEVATTAIPLALSAYVRSALLTLEHVLIPARLRDSGESSADAYSRYGILHGMALPLILYPMSPLSSFAGLLVPELAAAEGGRQRMNRIASEAMGATLAYSTVAAVLLSLFSEELGYAVYDSYEAGRYIGVLALIVPIMYMDHVTDSMLKGVGEQVFSMWVNISDSVLSVVLVWFLIPRMGIMGYALVIVIMEGYNFALSLMRLRRRLSIRINVLRTFLLPLLFSLTAALLTKALFLFAGSGAGTWLLVMKLVFALSVVAALGALSRCLHSR